MFEILPFAVLFLAVSLVAIIATVAVTARDGYRRIPRRH